MRATGQIVKTDLALFSRFSRLWLAALAIALVPAAYALIYLSSVWDPNAKTSDLPVGIVNLDEGFVYRDAPECRAGTRAGADAVGQFGFRAVGDADTARQGVKLGRLAFAVIIPADFSASAVPGSRPAAAR